MMQGKKVLVFGMARSGIAAAKLLLLRGAQVAVCDAKCEADFNGALDDLKAAGAVLRLGEQHPEELLEGMDALIVSPGIPVDHPAVVRARELGAEIWLDPRVKMGHVGQVVFDEKDYLRGG